MLAEGWERASDINNPEPQVVVVYSEAGVGKPVMWGRATNAPLSIHTEERTRLSLHCIPEFVL